MPSIANGSNTTLNVGIKGTVMIQPSGGTARIENPTGTLVAEFSDRRTFGPMATARSVKITSVTGSIYYEQGETGYSVTQATNKATGVTLNALYGEITLNAASLASATTVSFTLTNSQIDANDTMTVVRKSGGTAASYQAWVDSIVAGSAVICVRNLTAGALAEALVLAFSVTKNV